VGNLRFFWEKLGSIGKGNFCFVVGCIIKKKQQQGNKLPIENKDIYTKPLSMFFNRNQQI
jgi:hypothetical protein